MISLSYSNKLLDTGFSVITVGKNKVPNTQWKIYQTDKISKILLEKQQLINKYYI